MWTRMLISKVMGTNQTAIALGFQKYSARQTDI